MLEQMVQQKASKTEAKSKQSQRQRQIQATPESKTSHHVVQKATRERDESQTDDALRADSVDALDFEPECRSRRCHERPTPPSPADYLIVAASDWSAKISPSPWLCCADCYHVASRRAIQLGLSQPWRIVRSVR